MDISRRRTTLRNTNTHGVGQATIAPLTDQTVENLINVEDRKAQLRRQITETMERVRRLTAEREERRQEHKAEGPVKSSRRQSRAELLEAAPSLTTLTKPAVHTMPQYDPDSPFESRRRSTSSRSNATRPGTMRESSLAKAAVSTSNSMTSGRISQRNSSKNKEGSYEEYRNTNRSTSSQVQPDLGASADRATDATQLSPETSKALASLEATLAQLRLRSPEGHSGMPSEKRGERRPLSPSKELLRRREANREQSRSAHSVFADTAENQRRPSQKPDVQSRRSDEQVRRRYSRMSTDRGVQTAAGTLLIDKAMQYMPVDGYDRRSEPRVAVPTDKYVHSARDSQAGRRRNGVQKAILSGISVLLDVRGQDGTDLSDQLAKDLRKLGVKTLDKVTDENKDGTLVVDYIVFKNGRPSTLRYHRSVSQDSNCVAPMIVSVNWAYECIKQGKHLNGRDYLIEVGKQSPSINTIPAVLASAAPQAPDLENPLLPARPADHTAHAQLVARKKMIQYAPARPSPLASRCWNLDASTSSIATTATQNTMNAGNLSG